MWRPEQIVLGGVERIGKSDFGKSGILTKLKYKRKDCTKMWRRLLMFKCKLVVSWLKFVLVWFVLVFIFLFFALALRILQNV